MSRGARNAGLAQATTPYVVFLDGDDRLLPDCVERLTSELRRHPDAVAAGGYPRYLSSDGRRTGGRSAHVPLPLPQDQIRAGSITPWPTFAALVSSVEAARAIQGFDEALTDGRSDPEDLDFWARLAARGELVHCAAVVGEYRINPRGATATKPVAVAEGAAFVRARIRARLGGADLRREDFRWRPTWRERRRVSASAHFFVAGAAFLDRRPATLGAHLVLALLNGRVFTLRRLAGLRRETGGR